MNINWIVLAIVPFLTCCGQNNNSHATQKTAGTAAARDNHLYFLSIGNAHYVKDDGAKITDFINVKGANTSASYFSRFFSCYGKGALLTSRRDRLLSKEILTTSLDSMINIALKDSMSITFIYYCGHGFSDGAGNLYLVPGDHRYDQSAASLSSLLSINDIQQKINDATHRAYASDPLPASVPEVKRADSLLNDQMRQQVQLGKRFNMDSGLQQVSKTIEVYQARFRRPRFMIITDCCTEDIDKVNYTLLISKELNNRFSEPEEKLKTLDPKMRALVTPILTTVKYNLSVQPTKSMMWQYGNRTIYTAEIGKLAPMVASPVDKEEVIGPICRRLTLFFNGNNNTFNLAQLLGRLADEKYDALSAPPKFEEGNDGHMYGHGNELNKYQNKIGTDLHIEKRDSVAFFCDKK